ncbi:hypothetical protein, partial [Streptomyces sp. rh195]|uniref:hypothetical protein n=1 Tax=Streptomyces sp. rh195 TaxID=2034271 RepID=UPI00211D4B4B
MRRPGAQRATKTLEVRELVGRFGGDAGEGGRGNQRVGDALVAQDLGEGFADERSDGRHDERRSGADGHAQL